MPGNLQPNRQYAGKSQKVPLQLTRDLVWPDFDPVFTLAPGLPESEIGDTYLKDTICLLSGEETTRSSVPAKIYLQPIASPAETSFSSQTGGSSPLVVFFALDGAICAGVHVASARPPTIPVRGV